MVLSKQGQHQPTFIPRPRNQAPNCKIVYSSIETKKANHTLQTHNSIRDPITLNIYVANEVIMRKMLNFKYLTSVLTNLAIALT